MYSGNTGASTLFPLPIRLGGDDARTCFMKHFCKRKSNVPKTFDCYGSSIE